MPRNPFWMTLDRLGFFAYALAISGGRPDWSLLFAARTGGARSLQDPFTDTVPFDIQREREKIAGY